MNVAMALQGPVSPEEQPAGNANRCTQLRFNSRKSLCECTFGCVRLDGVLCFVSLPLFLFLGHSLAHREQGPHSAARHRAASLLAPPAAFRKRIFGMGTELSPLFTSYLPIPCCFVARVSAFRVHGVPSSQPSGPAEGLEESVPAPALPDSPPRAGGARGLV